MVATINENIRWYKANDPYYYEVDNLPLIDLVQNDKDLKDRLNLLILESSEWVNAAYVQTEVQGAVGNSGIIDVNGEGGTMPNNVIDWVLGLGYVKISDIDLTAYVTHTYLNGLNYIDDAALVAYGYATSAWVAIQNFATQSWVNSLNHATQDWVTGKNYATENWVEQKGYLTEVEIPVTQKLTLFMEKTVADGGFNMKTIFSGNHGWTTRNLTTLSISVPDNTRFIYVKVRSLCGGSVTGTQYARIDDGYPELQILANQASSADGSTGYNGNFLYLPLLKTTNSNGTVSFSFQTKSSNFDINTNMWAVGYVTE